MGRRQVGTQTTGRFWLSMAVVAGAGLLIALANHVGTWTKGLRLRMSPGTFVLAFLPASSSAWAGSCSRTSRATGWQEGRIDSWSSSIGILGVVHSVGLWHGVLAFGFGLMLGLSLDGVPAPSAETERALRRPALQRTSRSRPSAAEADGPARGRAHADAQPS